MQAYGHIVQNNRWLFLDCGIGWYKMYQPEIQRILDAEGTWVQASDEARRGSHDRGRIPDRLARLPSGLLQPPSWGPHVSIIRGESLNPAGVRAAQRMLGQRARFECSLELQRSRHTGHWLFHVRGPDLHQIREDCGLSYTPRVPFHLTLGVVGS